MAGCLDCVPDKCEEYSLNKIGYVNEIKFLAHGLWLIDWLLFFFVVFNLSAARKNAMDTEYIAYIYLSVYIFHRNFTSRFSSNLVVDFIAFTS